MISFCPLVQSRTLRISPEPGKAPRPPTHQEIAQGISLCVFQLHPFHSDGCLGAAQVWTFIALCDLRATGGAGEVP